MQKNKNKKLIKEFDKALQKKWYHPLRIMIVLYALCLIGYSCFCEHLTNIGFFNTHQILDSTILPIFVILMVMGIFVVVVGSEKIVELLYKNNYSTKQ